MKNEVRQKWWVYRDAERRMVEAKDAIVTTDLSIRPNTCITHLIVTGNLNSTTTPVVCECFRPDEFCGNSNCPMYEQNVQYIFLKRQCEQTRRDFFSVFRLSRSK